jgi:hypothetical protein
LQREAGWKDNHVFSEYFYGGNGTGLGAAPDGAAHQEEWLDRGHHPPLHAASPSAGIRQQARL